LSVAEADQRGDDQPPRLWLTLREPFVGLFELVGSVLVLTGQTLVWLIRPPYRFGQLLLAMEFIGVQSVFIVALTGVFSGMVLALQTTYSLRAFGAEGIVGQIVAVSLTREIAPVFSALMVTARAGSAMAAELGNMRVTEQIDALVTMAVSPVQYLLSPRLLASVLMMPLLCIVYTCVGMAGAYLVAVQWMGVDPGLFVSNIEKNMVPHDFYMGLIKAAVFGFLISAISCTRGFYASGGARGVGQATTEAVVHSAVSLLVVNYLLTSWLMGNPS
jgi:phospholipid/cholesterol/gamma-HCH transport system permease protein